MNPIAPLSSARQAVTRAEPLDRAPERNDEATYRTSHPAGRQAEFSALLALLAGTGARVRHDILKQLPAEGASLVDRLLAEAGADATAEAGAGEAGPSAGNDTVGQMLGRDGQEAAADAMRYGQLLRNELGLQTPGTDRDRSTAATSRPDTTAADTTATDTATGAISPRGSGARQHAHATDTLSRIVSRCGASVEQLLALGDEKGADARAALDGILSQAGTATGEQLAAFSNDSTTLPAAAVAASALAAANARSRSHADTPVRDADALVPEFRTRIDRVIARMKQEYGHNVTLVETARSQERQDALFEQGRTRPGNIVTWTRDSAHTRGEAADMLVDGTYNNAEGFARLQRIAREEGLRTLGVKDPGHLEMPRSARQADAMLGGAAKVSARIEHVNMQSSNAASPAVAPVAGVASVAGVARVADATMPAVPASTANAGAGASMYAVLGGAAGKGDSGSASNGSAFGKGERDEQGAPLANGRKLGQRRVESDDSNHGHAFGQVAGPALTSSAAKADVVAPAAGADSAQRVADLQDKRDATPGSVSRLTLSVDGANGDSDRITIDLRGKSVGTHIDTSAANADVLRSRTGELQEALGRHGLDGDTVRISATARADAADGARGVGADRDALKLAAAQQGSANDGAAGNGQQRSGTAREWDKQDDARRARDEQRDAKHDAKQDAKRDGRERGQQRFFNEGQR